MTFGQKIHDARKEKGCTQRELAALIGAKHNSVSDWENDKNRPDQEMLRKLCSALNITPNYLLDAGDDYLTHNEAVLLNRYRATDSYGKEAVDMLLLHEYRRTLAQRDAGEGGIYHIRYYQELASAGTGEYLFDDIPADIITVKDTPEARKADFVIGVNGDSMEPLYHDGDKVYVRKTAALDTGKVGIFTKGNDCFIKKLGPGRLISLNAAYPDIPASEDIRLVGEVIGKAE